MSYLNLLKKDGSRKWIEKTMGIKSFRQVLSLPARECGLKQSACADVHYFMESLPARECGLNHIAARDHDPEIPGSLPARECGLKQPGAPCYFIYYTGSLPARECGLKLLKFGKTEFGHVGHSLHGSVD